MDPLEPSDPRVVGRYTLAGRLGRRGMGEVFFGRSPSGRAVAVKVIRPELAAEPAFRHRFAREVEAARQVSGFYTAPVVDADSESDPPWMATAFVPGPSLAIAIAEHGPLPAGSLRVLGAGLAEALEAIHACGLVHRDFKPGNIILAVDGPRVIDFGIARALDATSMTATGAVVGTPAFMAPEQLTGRPVGPPVDVFALGMVLAGAAGVRPFGAGPSAALAFRIVHQEPDLSGLSGKLRGLIAGCLAKNPADRPPVAEILRRLSYGAPEQWPPPTVTAMIASPRFDPESIRYRPEPAPREGDVRTRPTVYDPSARARRATFKAVGWSTLFAFLLYLLYLFASTVRNFSPILLGLFLGSCWVACTTAEVHLAHKLSDHYLAPGPVRWIRRADVLLTLMVAIPLLAVLNFLPVVALLLVAAGTTAELISVATQHRIRNREQTP